MNAIAGGLHPSFDALSRHADLPDVERMKTRTGRHVATCARCREIVEEIQAMGDAARAIELPGAPAELWSRIERQLSVSAPESERVVAVPASRDVGERLADGDVAIRSRTGDWSRRAVLGLAALAVLGAAGVFVGSQRSLGAATPSRLSLSGDYVAPGGSVTARYRPIAALTDRSTLTVWARYEALDVPVGSFDQPLVRAGILRRVSAQEYSGSVTLPPGKAIGFFAVGDSAGRVIDRSSGRPHFLGAVVALGDSGRPSLDALVALLDQYRYRLEEADAARIADVMERHHRDRPETWLVTYSVTHRGVVRDFVKRFESLERAYAGWDARLVGVPRLSAFVESRMGNIGEYLDDSVRADFWRKRLAADHPREPDVLAMWVGGFREVSGDSIRIALAELERRHGSGREASEVEWRALQLAEQSGDSALMRRWRLRVAASFPAWVLDWGKMGWLRDTAALSELDTLLRRSLSDVQREGTAHGPTVWKSTALASQQAATRMAAIRTRLAAVQLLRGEARTARESLDVVVRSAAPGCPLPETVRWRAEASRRLGELDSARDDLAYLAVFENWRVRVVGDSAPHLLGSRFTMDSWATATAAATEQQQKCFAAMRERLRVEGS